MVRGWLFDGLELTEIPDGGYKGFVYIILNHCNARFYIGQKSFWLNRTLKPLKGKKRKRRLVVESDWKEYCGSSAELLKDIKKQGLENFSRQIIRLCKTKADMNIFEATEILKRDGIRDEQCYNKSLLLRVHQNQFQPHEASKHGTERTIGTG